MAESGQLPWQVMDNSVQIIIFLLNRIPCNYKFRTSLNNKMLAVLYCPLTTSIFFIDKNL